MDRQSKRAAASSARFWDMFWAALCALFAYEVLSGISRAIGLAALLPWGR